MLEKFRARRERRKREQQETDQELRAEQEAAEERMGIDPAEYDIELRQAEAAPWHRGILRWLSPRETKEPPASPPDEK